MKLKCGGLMKVTTQSWLSSCERGRQASRDSPKETELEQREKERKTHAE